MTKTCRICKQPFLDRTKPKNAKTCRRIRCISETVRLRVARYRARKRKLDLLKARG